MPTTHSPATSAPALSLEPERLKPGVLAAAAGLVGFGLILYVAASWDDLGRFARFWLVGAVIGLGGLAALTLLRLRTGGILLAFAATGAMLALIGQTYQTGADPWSLFALWALLTLPWLLAARSDAVWCCWVVVVTTAIVLWQQTQGPLDVGIGLRGDLSPAPRLLGVHTQLLAAWGMALGLCLLMAPLLRIDTVLGTRRWAFRLAVVIVLVMIAVDTLTAVLGWPRARTADYLAGLACLAGIAAAVATRVRGDVTLLAASALAIDASLIGGFAKLVLSSGSRETFGSYLLVGAVAAGIVAASVIVLMRLAGSDAAVGEGDRAGAPLPAGQPAAIASARPWAVSVLSGIGAVLAALPFIAALWFLLGTALERGATTYAVALTVLAVAVPSIRLSRGLLVEQLATIGLACGALLLGWGLFRDLPNGAAGLTAGGLSLAAALALGRPWLAALLAAAAAPAFALALTAALPVPAVRAPGHLYAIVWSILAMAGAVALLARRARPDWPPAQVGHGTVDAAVAGWTAATLAGLAVSAGTTFLLSVHLRMGHGAPDPQQIRVIAMAAGAVSGGLAATGAYLLLREVPSLRTVLGMVLMAAAAALSLVMPALGATVLVLAAAIVGRSRVLAIAAVVGALWIVGAFYYDLAMPLIRKAMILAGTGVALGAVALLAGGGGVGGLALPGVRAEGRAEPRTGMDAPAISRVLTALGLLAAGGVSVQAITSREALIRTGAPVLVELAPVDPRSLMQGDFMALRFQLPDAVQRHQPERGGRPLAIGRRGPDGVVHLTRIGDGRAPLGPDETAIALKWKGGRWVLVTDAWYFKEGTARKWEAARYGELRVLSGGEALLVGLADKDRVPIR